MRYVALTCAALLVLAGTVSAALEERSTLAEAQEAAGKQKRDIMLLYTGTDWCPACVYLEQQILTHPAFEQEFGKRLVVVREVFPRTPELRALVGHAELERLQREMTAYRISSLPCAVLLDAQGLPYAMVQGVDRSAEAYIRRFRDAMALRLRRDQALAEAVQREGLERAQALVAALELLPDALRGKYTQVLQEVETLDPNHALGYHDRLRQETREQEMRASFLQMRQGFAGMLQPEQLNACRRQVEAFLLENPDMPPDLRQECYRIICDGYTLQRDWAHAYRYALLAIGAAPSSDLAEHILLPYKAHLEKLFPEQCRPSEHSGTSSNRTAPAQAPRKTQT